MSSRTGGGSGDLRGGRCKGNCGGLRSDRRHIQDRDIQRLRDNVITKLNLEMGNTPEIVDVALRIVQDEVCVVPEKREEVTTEASLHMVF